MQICGNRGALSRVRLGRCGPNGNAVPAGGRGFRPVVSRHAKREDVLGVSAPTLRPIHYDPRLERPLPWKLEWTEDTAPLPVLLAWSVFFCTTLLVLPLVFAGWMVWVQKVGPRQSDNWESMVEGGSSSNKP